MRFPVSAMLCVIASFIFFIIWAVSSYFLSVVSEALIPRAAPEAVAMITMIQTAFGIIAALFFFVGIILVFILDSTADEEEMYWRER